MKISKNYTVVKSLIDFADNPARDFSYMDERRKKQNARGWLVVLGLGGLKHPALTGFNIHIGFFFFKFGVGFGRVVRSNYQPFKFLKLEKL